MENRREFFGKCVSGLASLLVGVNAFAEEPITKRIQEKVLRVIDYVRANGQKMSSLNGGSQYQLQAPFGAEKPYSFNVTYNERDELQEFGYDGALPTAKDKKEDVSLVRDLIRTKGICGVDDRLILWNNKTSSQRMIKGTAFAGEPDTDNMKYANEKYLEALDYFLEKFDKDKKK